MPRSAAVAKESSISRSELTRRMRSLSWRMRAAASTSLDMFSVRMRLVGFTRSATTVAAGTTSCNNSSNFEPTSTFNEVMPVRLPPGRARLETSPTGDRVGRYLKDDWYCSCRRLCDLCCGRATGRHNHSDLLTNQVKH